MSSRASRAAAAALLACAAFALPARAKQASAKPPSYKMPKGWQLRTDDKDGIYLSNGESSIILKRGDAKAAEKLAPELYGGSPQPANALINVSKTKVAGAAAKRLVRRFERYHGGGETGGVDSIYEEIVVVPSPKKGAFWTLDFQTPRGSFDSEPKGGLGDWQAFLRSFKPS